jgi:hypothetical protein
LVSQNLQWRTLLKFQLPLTTVTRFAQPSIHTDTLSVLLSALYLYLLVRVLIWRRIHTSGAGSSFFCALTVE